MSLPTQVWTGDRRPSPDRFEEPTHHLPGGWVKPSGGLWTSPYIDRRMSAWCQFALCEEFRVRRDIPVFNIWHLVPEPDARIFRIDSYRDLEILIREYPRTGNPLIDVMECPDWTLVARDFDGVHLTEEGQWATRLSQPATLYGWDCESVLWLRWAFAQVIYKGLVWVPYESEPPETETTEQQEAQA